MRSGPLRLGSVLNPRAHRTAARIRSLSIAAAVLIGCHSSPTSSTTTSADSLAVPTGVPGGLTFVNISASGSARTCGLTSAGSVYCWGDGHSTEGDFPLGGLIYSSATPVNVGTQLQFAKLSVAYIHSCAVTAAGAAFCWGSNVAGEAGIGSTDTLSAPRVQVAGGIALDTASAGAWHSCGLHTGIAYCWGLNHRGQLGAATDSGPQQCHWPNGAASCSLSPVAVAGGLTFVRISTGDYHTCALTAQGKAYCWGDNLLGQLGNNSLVDHSSVPVPVAGGLTFSAMQAGGYHTCALKGDGTAYCWGRDWDGELGTGVTIDSVPTPTLVNGGLTFRQISSGEFHSCGVTTTFAAYCWGDDEAAQLGNGIFGASSNIPVQVSGGHQFVDVATGLLHTCALTSAGVAYCWGDELCQVHACW